MKQKITATFDVDTLQCVQGAIEAISRELVHPPRKQRICDFDIDYQCGLLRGLLTLREQVIRTKVDVKIS